MSKIKNGGLDQYGAEPFEQQRFRAAGDEGVKEIEKKLQSIRRYNNVHAVYNCRYHITKTLHSLECHTRRLVFDLYKKPTILQ